MPSSPKQAEQTSAFPTKKSSATSKRGSRKKKQPKQRYGLALGDAIGTERREIEYAEDDAPRGLDQYEDRYVAFIDILGFKELIHRSATPSAPSSAKVARLFDALNLNFRSSEDFFQSRQPSTGEPTDLRVHTFSDFVVASCRLSADGLALLIFVAWTISKDWLSKGYLSRGAITKGQILHSTGTKTGGSATVFGPAFLDAYTLESTVAEFPRIVLSKSARQDLDDFRVAKTKSLKPYSCLTRKCGDGPTCVDTFSQFRTDGFDLLGKDVTLEAGQLAESILGHLKDSCDNPAWYRKSKWLAEEFNRAIDAGPYRKLKIDLT